MYITQHAKNRRGKSFRVIENEISSGMEIEKDVARTILDRNENRRFSKREDRFILRKDFQGIYILTKNKNSEWVVITHIDLSDNFRQDLLQKLYGSPEGVVIEKINENVKLADNILFNFNFEEIELIRIKAMEEAERFRRITIYPNTLFFDLTLNDKKKTFRMVKGKAHKITKVSWVEQ